jgi:signal transduction histidine kinase
LIEPLVVLDAGPARADGESRLLTICSGCLASSTQGVALRELGDRGWNGSGVWPALQAALTGDGGFRTMELARDFPGHGRRTILVDARRLSRYGDDLLLLGFRDISDRKQAEEQREAMLAHEAALRREAEAAAQAKDRFLAVVSHELRTPLSPVVMTIAAMARHPGLPADLREDVAIIRRNIELETRLIDDLLDLSRVASGKMRFEVQPTSLHAVLRQAVECCPGEASAAAPHVRLDLKADNDMVAGDPARLQQVFRNLVTNAAKFSPEGGEVVVHTASREGKVRVEVRDHGIGIPPEYLPRIFEAFEQADLRRTRQFGGLGLGLAICKEVVDMHAGSICADSAGPGQGATFTVGSADARFPGTGRGAAGAVVTPRGRRARTCPCFWWRITPTPATCWPAFWGSRTSASRPPAASPPACNSRPPSDSTSSSATWGCPTAPATSS